VTRTGTNPTQAQIAEIAGSDVTGEIVMLNLVAYPSRESFLEMVTATSYGQALEHRERGLAGTVLICCTELPLDQEQRAGAV